MSDDVAIFEPVDVRADAAIAAVSTGHLPDPEHVARLLREAYDEYRHLDKGVVADYIPALATVDPALFGMCVVGVSGGVHEASDADH